MKFEHIDRPQSLQAIIHNAALELYSTPMSGAAIVEWNQLWRGFYQFADTNHISRLLPIPAVLTSHIAVALNDFRRVKWVFDVYEQTHDIVGLSKRERTLIADALKRQLTAALQNLGDQHAIEATADQPTANVSRRRPMSNGARIDRETELELARQARERAGDFAYDVMV